MMFTNTVKVTSKWGVMSKRCLSVNNKRNKAFSWLGPVFFAGLSLTAAGLGTWQVQRYYWKVDLLDKINQRSHEEALMLRNKGDFLELARQAKQDR